MVDVTPSRTTTRPFPNAAERLTEWERWQQPTPRMRGEIRAMRMCRLEPAERNRVEALARVWGIA